LLSHTLNSLRNQTYKNFTVHLIDHGSNPPVDAELLPKDIPIELTRYDVNSRDDSVIADQHGTDVQENIICDLKGTHYLTLADDDVLLPNTFETIANLLTLHPQIELLAWGNLPFDHDKKTAHYNREILTHFNSKLVRYETFKAGIAFCSGWGIGAAVDFFYPTMAHPSAGVCSTDLLKRTQDKQGRVFVKPLGDVGFVGFLFNCDWGFFLNSPLTIIGKSISQESSQRMPNSRLKWNRDIANLKYSPLKGSTFMNMGAESHLKVLIGNGIDKKWDCSLRPDFFLRHLLEIFEDKPWSTRTVDDINETIPLLVESTQHYLSMPYDAALKKVRSWVREQLNSSSHGYPSDHGKQQNEAPVPGTMKFDNILEYVEYLAGDAEPNQKISRSKGLRWQAGLPN
jgi:hypothetical protein